MGVSKLIDCEKIVLLAQTVNFALLNLKCDGSGMMHNAKTGESTHWELEFAKRLRDCGFDCDDDAVEYAKTPDSKRKGKHWKELCTRLKDKGYTV